jgi:DNA repair ATPase RecN
LSTEYEQLNHQFEEQLRQTAVFLPMAFHVHSPESHDWAKGPEASSDLNDPERLSVDALLDELAKHFSIVCITDHMKSEFACKLAAASLARDDITVFPGVEINCEGGQLGGSYIHVLAIFPPETSNLAIERIYNVHVGGGFPTDRTGKETIRVESLTKLAHAIRGENGVFLLAHVDEEQRGHRSRFRVTRHGTLALHETKKGTEEWKEIEQQVSEEYFAHLAELNPDAVEIMNPEARIHYARFTLADGAIAGVPCVIRSDHHSIEDLARDHLTTYLKVSRTDFTCVSDALKFYETRVRFKDDLPSTPSPRIVGMRLRCTSGKGLFDEAVIAFNPNLNCIIGPRGSGKSTVVEALRYVLGWNAALESDHEEARDHVNFSDIAARIQEANLGDTLIELIYEIDGDRYCLTTTFDPQSSASIGVFGLGGEPRPMAESAVGANFPVRLYSWSEIETLGRRPDLQRMLLDRLIPDLEPLTTRSAALRDSLAANRDELEQHARELDRLLKADNGLLRRFVQYKADFEQINTPEVAELFSALDSAREKLALLRETKERLHDLRERLAATIEVSSLDLAPSFEAASDGARAWWESEVGEPLELIPLADEVADSVRALVDRIDERIRTLDGPLEAQEVETGATEHELRATTRTAPDQEVRRDQREERKRRFDEADHRRTSYEAAWSEFQKVFEARKTLTRELDDVQGDVSDLRDSSRSLILEQLAQAETGLAIDVTLDPGADRVAAADFLGEQLTRDAFGNYRQTRWAERALKMAPPTQIARAIFTNDVTVLEAEGVKFGSAGGLKQDEGATLVEFFHPFSTDPDALVETVVLEKLTATLNFEETPVDDVMRILLDGRSVDQRSPGQRSSAMLPLVALSESVPLVIDQPEDNLDNEMVGETLTRILAKLKERRQIIVTTHNPNIVVSGDAEQLVVLKVGDGAHAAAVDVTGSIDDSRIIRRVLSIMEGGRDAFEKRNRRYELIPNAAEVSTTESG